MVFVAFVGKPGSGKTTTQTYFALKEYLEKHRRLLTNYTLKFPTRAPIAGHVAKRLLCCPSHGYRPEPLDVDALIDPSNNSFRSALTLLDEGWGYFESRNSNSKINKKASQVFLQMRKREMDCYVTSQMFMQLDVRFRINCDYVIKCDKKKDYIFWTMFNRNNGRVTKHVINAKPIYSLFDTYELVDHSKIDKAMERADETENNARHNGVPA